MSTFETRPMVPADADEIVELKLRKYDELELRASMPGIPLKEILRMCTLTPNVMVGLVDGKIIGLFGSLSESNDPKKGVVWSFGTDVAYDHMDTLTTLAKGMVEEWLDTYPNGIGNYMSLENTPAIKWIKELGFEFKGDPIESGDVQFRYFERKR